MQATRLLNHQQVHFRHRPPWYCCTSPETASRLAAKAARKAAKREAKAARRAEEEAAKAAMQQSQPRRVLYL